ncbi:MAG: EAL domain-containing response regulator [Pseudohongiellaceae bacterium]
MTVKRLLILDDDLMVGKTIRFIAEGAGFDCQATDSPQEFFALLEDWRPTHIALDLVMPQMDGVEVMLELSRRSCTAHIIISSGVGSRVLDAARRSAAEHDLNIIGILSKPFKPSTLQTLLNSNDSVRSPASVPQDSTGHDEPVCDTELLRALEQRELFLMYQPKIHCATRSPVGFEALVRWQHPERGLIMPNEFIPLAESSGLIDPLTTQVVDTALSWFAVHFAEEDLHMSVNISARNLRDLSFADHVATLCAELGLSPTKLVCELTETSTMEDPVASLDLLTRLRLKGFMLSIDDFGTGFSSMLQLVRLPFSEIKIDKSFVMTAMRSGESRAVIKSIVELGHSLGLRSSAEGVEDDETLGFLDEIGCQLAQGYRIARPMMADDALAWYRDYVGDPGT